MKISDVTFDLVCRLCARVAPLFIVTVAIMGAWSLCRAADAPYELPLAPFHSEGKRISAEENLGAAVVKNLTNALNAGDVDALEQLANSLLRQKTKTPAGFLPIRYIHGGIRIYLSQDNEDAVKAHTFDRILETIHAWQKRYPNSGTAIVAEADVFLRRALAARGGETIDQLPPGRLKLFRTNVLIARGVLLEKAKIGKTDPLWYEKMATVGQYIGADRQQFLRLIDAGMRDHPEDLEMADSGVTYMVSRWGGGDEMVAAYIKHVLSRVSKEDAPIVAARIYYRLLNSGFYYAGSELVYVLHTSVEQVERAMADVVARYPDPVNVDAQAMVTCALGDKLRLRPLLAEIGDSPILSHWAAGSAPDGSYFSLCRNFAAQN